MKRFELVRHQDVSGISGEGVVAEGVEFSDGKCAMRWLTETASTATYDNIEDLRAIHAHGGASTIVFLDRD